ncbi:2024_t:CDS:2, partial [Ambispora leptoticha]
QLIKERYKTTKESPKNDEDKNTERAPKAKKELVVSTRTITRKRRKIDEELPGNDAKLTKITRKRRRKVHRKNA